MSDNQSTKQYGVPEPVAADKATYGVTNQSAAVEVIPVIDKKVWCDGTLSASGKRLDPVLGHPKVYLNMGDKGYVDCPYCGKRYQLDRG